MMVEGATAKGKGGRAGSAGERCGAEVASEPKKKSKKRLQVNDKQARSKRGKDVTRGVTHSVREEGEGKVTVGEEGVGGGHGVVARAL